MKKNNFILIGFFALAMILAGFEVHSQGIKLGGTRNGLNPGDTVKIPLRISGTGIHTVEIFFNYDENVLAPQASIFSQVYFPVQTLGWIANPDYPPTGNGIYSFTFFSNTVNALPVMTDRLIGYFCFIYIGGPSGTTTIHLRKSPPDANPVCNFYNNLGVKITITSYSADFSINGSTGISATTLYSIATGGPLDWDDPASWATSPSGSAGAVLTPAKCFNTVIQGDEIQINGTLPGVAKCNNLNINPTGKLTLTTGNSLAVSGNFLIEGDATGTGSFLNQGTLTVTGTTSVQRWVTANWTAGLPDGSTKWHYVSSPVSGATINTFLGSMLNKWNEVTTKWDSLVWPTTLPLVPGVGYGLAKHAPDGLVTFSGGTINNNASYAPGITLTGAYGSATGWNLLGNPYPCAINWNALTKSNVLGSVYTWNELTHNYAYYNGAAGTLLGGIIPAEQAFFVQALTNTATITIPEAAREHSGTMLYKNTIENLLKLNVKGSGAAEDFAFIHFRPEATIGFDFEYDTYKLFGLQDAPQLYSITPSEILSINSLADVASRPTVAMGLKVGVNGTYTLTASDLGTFAAGSDIYLEDVLANKVQDLNSNPVYTFSATSGDLEHRFNIHFASVGVSENKPSGIKIYSNENTVFVNIPSDMKGNIVVYNMLGIEITRTTIQAYSLNKINLDVPTGFYLVKVDGDSNTNAGKVFIK